MNSQPYPPKSVLKSSLERFITAEDDVSGRPSEQTYQVGGDHYLNLGIQPWDAMRAWMTPAEFRGFLRGNVIKYVARFQNKGGVQDLRKARHYLDTLIADIERNQPGPGQTPTTSPE